MVSDLSPSMESNARTQSFTLKDTASFSREALTTNNNNNINKLIMLIKHRFALSVSLLDYEMYFGETSNFNKF